MSCIRCGSNDIKDMQIKLKTVDGTFQEVYRCLHCGYLFQEYKPAFSLFGKRGKQGSPCEVIQMLNGEEVGRFESITEASVQTGVPRGSIVSCVLGDSYTAGGYEWVRA